MNEYQSYFNTLKYTYMDLDEALATHRDLCPMELTPALIPPPVVAKFQQLASSTVDCISNEEQKESYNNFVKEVNESWGFTILRKA